MRKSLLLAAAGAVVVFTGCQDSVMEERRYVPAPQDEPEVMTPVAPVAPAVRPEAPKFVPMTGVKSSGGVDSVPGGKSPASAAADGYYIVVPNDNPAKIAQKLHVKLSDLMAANNLTNESAKRLKVGQKLVIPAGGKAVKTSAPAARKQTAASAPAEAVPADGKYTVKAGDSLDRIAKKYGVKLSDLMKANNLTEASARRLQIGQKLVIPGKAVSPVAAPADTPAAADAAVVTDPVSVTTDSAPAATSQGMEDLDAIFPETEESLESFAKSHNVTPDEVRRLNSNVTDKVTPEMVIYLPKR